MMRICFVCQSGELEIQAVLLAASLRLHFPPDTELIAAHPSLLGPFRSEVEKAFDALDVITLPIRNPLREDCAVGHKLAAMMLLGGPDTGMFLDTGTLAMSAPGAFPQELAAVPATKAHFPLPVWQRAYQALDMSFPAPQSSQGEDEGASPVPYYNAGMIAVPGQVAGWLAASWIETAARLDAEADIPKLRFLDQLSLPIAAMRIGLTIRSIDRRWNFPGWQLRVGDHAPPTIFHYLGLNRLKQEAATRDAARRAAGLLPAVRRALVGLPWMV